MPLLNTREQTLVADEYIRIREWLNDLCTSHVIRSTVVCKVCKLELAWLTYGLCKQCKVTVMKCIFVISFIPKILVCTIIVRFLQIGSHLIILQKLFLTKNSYFKGGIYLSFKTFIMHTSTHIYNWMFHLALLFM